MPSSRIRLSVIAIETIPRASRAIKFTWLGVTFFRRHHEVAFGVVALLGDHHDHFCSADSAENIFERSGGHQVAHGNLMLSPRYGRDQRALRARIALSNFWAAFDQNVGAYLTYREVVKRD